jgi:glycerol kinase
VHATDVTNASRTLLFDIHELRWDPALLDALGVPEAVLPAVRPSAAVHAHTNADAFLGAEVPSPASPATSTRRCSGRRASRPGPSRTPTARAPSS